MKKSRQRAKRKPEEVFDVFGSSDPRKMPSHFFSRALRLNFDSAKKAEVRNQNYTVAPRHWYIDADFRCQSCEVEYTWSADEQKVWFEQYRFYIDSYPKHCRTCRANHRHLAKIQKDYDAEVGAARAGGSHDLKRRLIEIVDELERSLKTLPEKMLETRDQFRDELSGSDSGLD